MSSVEPGGRQQLEAELRGFFQDTCRHPEVLVSLRCPHCQKLLARCAVRGMIEIVCTRCKALVRKMFE